MPIRWPEFLHPMADTVLRLRPMILGMLGTGYPLNRGERFAPFFIVGSGRCGMTLLRRILQASNEVHIPPETDMLCSVIPFFLRNRDRPWNYLVRNVLAMFEYHLEFEPFEISLRPLVPELNAVPMQSRSLSLMLDSLYRYHGQQTGQTFSRWGDKTPWNTFFMEPIRRIFPDALFIHIIRDGADVAYSRHRSGFEQDIADSGRRWVRAIRTVERFSRRHPGRCAAT